MRPHRTSRHSNVPALGSVAEAGLVSTTRVIRGIARRVPVVPGTGKKILRRSGRDCLLANEKMGAKVGRAALPHAGESRERESRGNGEEFAWPAVVRWRTTLHSVTCSLRVVRERSPLPAIYSKLVLFPGDAAGQDPLFQMLTGERPGRGCG